MTKLALAVTVTLALVIALALAATPLRGEEGSSALYAVSSGAPPAIPTPIGTRPAPPPHPSYPVPVPSYPVIGTSTPKPPRATPTPETFQAIVARLLRGLENGKR